jgi:hypothetical protein
MEFDKLIEASFGELKTNQIAMEKLRMDDELARELKIPQSDGVTPIKLTVKSTSSFTVSLSSSIQ